MRDHTWLGWAVLTLTVGLVAAVVLALVVSCSLGVRWVPPEGLRGRERAVPPDLGLGSLLASPAAAADLRPGELELLARVVAAEATGEPEAGARAVAWTAVNRLAEAPEYGRTLTAVLLRPHQYARPRPVPDTGEAYLRAMLASVRALLGEGGDPSAGALYFFRRDLRPWPGWARRMEVRATIGRHVFLRPAD